MRSSLLFSCILTVFGVIVGVCECGDLYFYNSGNTVGWSQLGPPQNGGSIVNSPIAFNGSGGSVESTCTYHGQDGLRYHSEPRWNGNWNSGTTYFGYAVYVNSSWDFTAPERHVTAQFGVGSGPKTKPDYYQHWIRHTKFQMSINGTDYTFGTMVAAEWYSVVTRFTYSTTRNGRVQGWWNGRLAFDVSNVNVDGGYTDGEALWALGLYEADWYGGNVGSETVRSVYNAKCAIGSTYEVVDPTGSSNANTPTVIPTAPPATTTPPVTTIRTTTRKQTTSTP